MCTFVSLVHSSAASTVIGGHDCYAGAAPLEIERVALLGAIRLAACSNWPNTWHWSGGSAFNRCRAELAAPWTCAIGQSAETDRDSVKQRKERNRFFLISKYYFIFLGTKGAGA